MPADPTADDLRGRLAEAEETLRAIRAGEVDAVIVQGDHGEQVYTLRSADQPYRDLVEHLHEGAAIVTCGGDVLYCNRRFAELVNLPLERVIGTAVEGFLSMPDAPTESLLQATGYAAYQGRLVAHGGRSADVYVSWTVTVSEGVERRGLIVADLSELRTAQAERDRAEQSNRAKDEFMAMLAHELRNPMGAIAGAADLLGTAESQSAAGVRARAVITRQVRHLARLIDDLLDVGRLATGKILLARRPLDLSDLVRRTVATLAGDGRLDRRLEVTTDPIWVDADPTRLEQIVGNLVGNAVKYTDAGGRIVVSLRPSGGDAVLTVQDDGGGIAPDLLPRIFDLFVQGDQSLDRSHGGLGIGLTLVRRLVELHGGSVSASSGGPGRGAAFTVRLPAMPAPLMESAEPPGPPAAPRRRVLVVEDNRDAREMYCLALTLAGHEVLEAQDASRGLELLKSARPDVAFVDIGLPTLSGYDLARAVRADPAVSGVLLVAVTGYGSADDRDRARRAGFDHHLVKPVSTDKLLELLSVLSSR
jgi:signal transduction histidine kinase